MPLKPFETASVRMELQLMVTVQAPAGDIDRILDQITLIAPLVQGKYDRNSYETAPGSERYRPLKGAVAGEETEVRKRPGVSLVSFQIADDQTLLAELVEQIFQVHCYQEPVILVEKVLASRSKGLDDSKNPHRWWNTTGDWKKT